MTALVARPALALAAACERVEQRLLAAVLAIGRINLSFGENARRTDRETIDGAIFGFVDRTIALGARARRLQSGFIHREMALTFAGIALVIGVLLAAPLYL
jgi:NADH-quinone oxidoreductase subunit L